MAIFGSSIFRGHSVYRDEFLNEANYLFVFGSCDATDLLSE